MNIIRSQLLKLFPDAVETFGYVTKENPYEFDIKKTHANNAFVIAEGSHQEKDIEKTKVFRCGNSAPRLKTDGFSCHKAYKSINIILNIIILTVLCNTLFYSIVVGNGVPYSDHWRWIKTLLMPYTNN